MKPGGHRLTTESKLSAEVEPFIPNQSKEPRPTVRVLAPDGSKAEPNLASQEASRGGDRGPESPRQKVTAKDSQSAGGNKHGYSFSRRGRWTAQSQAVTPESAVSELLTKVSHPSTEARRPANVKWEGGLKKAEKRGCRVTPDPAENTRLLKRDTDPFEVKLSDFPALSCHAPGRGTTAPPPGQQTPCKDTSSEWGRAAGSPQNAQICRNQDNVSRSTEGQTVAPLPTSLTASWATVACQPPKRPPPRSAPSHAPSSKEGPKAEVEPEQTSEKKKRNKKKKKRKGGGDSVVVDQEVPVIEQEPPKFEDEEEFPDLTHAIIGSTKGQSPAIPVPSQDNALRMHKDTGRGQESREAEPPQDGKSHQDDRGRSGASVTKPPLPAPPTDSRKGQKAEKNKGEKKSKAPVQLDLGNMLAVLEQKQLSQKSKQESKPIILSVGGGLPVAQKSNVQKKHPRQPEKVAHNPLDSTSPLVKKGKQREVPKAKKPSPLKRIILKEREERKRNRLLEEQGLLPLALDSRPPDSLVEEVEPETLVPQQDECDSADLLEELQRSDTVEPVELEADQVEVWKETVKDGTHTDRDLVQRPRIHSRKFRDYCSQVLSKDVDECVTSLLKELVRFQDRLYQKDPMKARMKRRLIMGLREVLKHLKLRKVKCVIISPNCERIQAKGGLDEALHTIIGTCREQAVPFVFALSRKALGRCVNKAVPVSVVGVFNYDGAQDLYHKMIELSSEARKAYDVMVANLEKTPSEQQQASEQQDGDLGPGQPEKEEPEYVKIWKKMLDNEYNHRFLNFEEQLDAHVLATESGLQSDDDDGS